MIAAVISVALWLAELIAGCHCAQYAQTPNGIRCTVVVQRCELVESWHWIVVDVHPVCSMGCGS